MMKYSPDKRPASILLPLYVERKMQGSNSNTIQQQNRALLLRLIRDNREISRVELAKRTGLKKATVTVLIGDLLRAGILREGGILETETGRKAQGLQIASDFYYIIAIKFSREACNSALFDFRSDCVAIKRHALPEKMNLEELGEFLAGCVLQWVNIVGEQALAVGIAFEDMVSLDLWEGNNLQTRHFAEELRVIVEERCGLPVMINKAMFFASYNWRHLDADKLAMNTVLSVHVGGKVLSFLQATHNYVILGKQEFAGNIGDIQLERGGRIHSLNEVLASGAIVRRTLELRDQHPESALYVSDNIEIDDIINAYYRCDSLAVRVYNEAFLWLGNLLSIFANLLNPDCIVLSGKLPYCRETIQVIRQTMRDNTFARTRPQIVFYYPDTKSRQTNVDPVLKGICENVANQCMKNIDIIE